MPPPASLRMPSSMEGSTRPSSAQAVPAEKLHQVGAVHLGDARRLADVPLRALEESAQVARLEVLHHAVARVAVGSIVELRRIAPSVEAGRGVLGGRALAARPIRE